MEINRGRDERREVTVFDDLYGIDKTQWYGIKEIIKVERTIYLPKKESQSIDVSYYLTLRTNPIRSYN
jgi:hypothetical protein